MKNYLILINSEPFFFQVNAYTYRITGCSNDADTLLYFLRENHSSNLQQGGIRRRRKAEQRRTIHSYFYILFPYRATAATWSSLLKNNILLYML